MSELTAKENIKTADTVKRITATAVMAALTTLMTAYTEDMYIWAIL